LAYSVYHFDLARMEEKEREEEEEKKGRNEKNRQ
jgi:hypothetical protein